MKSITRRPSQKRPEECPKKLSPLGRGTSDMAAEIAPVSEFESPKLYMAGNPQLLPEPPPIFTPKTVRPSSAQSSLITRSMVGLALATMIKYYTKRSTAAFGVILAPSKYKDRPTHIHYISASS
jgi:hypothetical protein